MGIFADRATELVFDDALTGVLCPWIALERSADEMCHGASAVMSDMQRVPHIGMQIRSYMYDPGDVSFLSAAADGFLSIANGATVAPHHVEEDTFIKRTLSGLTYGAGVQASGAPMITAKVPAGTSYSTLNLSSDQSSFPSPDTGSDPVVMNRVYTFPGLKPWDVLLFNFYIPESALGARGTIFTFLFDSAPGVDAEGAANPAKEGTGHMGLKLRGDGRALLYELLEDDSWKFRYSFLWNTDPQSVPGTLVSITVASRMWQDEDGNYLGDRIAFVADTLTSPSIGGILDRISEIAKGGSRASQKNSPVYSIPRVMAKSLSPGWSTTVRLDAAADCRATFAALKHIYRESGYLVDDFIPLDQAVNTDADFFLYVQGVIPSGTSLSIEVQDGTGTALTATSPLTILNTALGQTAVRSFAPIQGMRHARVKISATSNTARDRTPTIVRYELDRSPIYASDYPLETTVCPARNSGLALPRTSIESVEIMPQETDPGAENATFSIVDLTGELDFLSNRNMVPVLCRTTYNPGGDYADLFRGYVLTASAQKMRWGGKAYPAKYATRYTLACVGEWGRASETLVPRRKTWEANPETGLRWRATDVIRFHACLIYPPETVDVPDIDVPLLSYDASAYTQEANARCVDTMQEMAADFLGAYMNFDEAAGPKGMLRMLPQKIAPYTNLAIFEIEHPTEIEGDSIPRLPHWAGSYPATTDGDQTILHTFIQAGTYNHWLEKAEGNSVTVFGGAINADANAAGASDGALLCQVAVNVESYNFLSLGPSDDGYPDGSSPEFYGRHVPIRVVDWKLGTQEAVDWKCRRVYEKACFARFYLSFDAPLLLVVDSTDTLQERPRRLRFYDAVQVRQEDGSLSQFLVVSCIPSYRKDGVQMARYVLITQSNIDTIGAIDKGSSTLREFMKAFSRVSGVNWVYGPPTSSQQKQGEPVSTNLMGLPTPTSLTIQDLDPSSPTFGAFINMDSFEAIYA